MRKILSYMMISGMALFAISCADPEEPTATNMSYGDWFVEEYYVNGQSGDQSTGSSTGSNYYIAFERFTLERDDSFILEDINGVVYVGDWTASDTNLILTGDDGTVFDFEIVYQTYEKLHLLQTFSSPTAGDIEIRYLLNHTDSDTY